MSILSYLRLDPAQQEKAEQWMESLRPFDVAEEDVTLAGREFTFSVYPTGLGDMLHLRCYIDGEMQQCSLGYDDDGELMP